MSFEKFTCTTKTHKMETTRLLTRDVRKCDVRRVTILTIKRITNVKKGFTMKSNRSLLLFSVYLFGLAIALDASPVPGNEGDSTEEKPPLDDSPAQKDGGVSLEKNPSKLPISLSRSVSDAARKLKNISGISMLMRSLSTSGKPLERSTAINNLMEHAERLKIRNAVIDDGFSANSSPLPKLDPAIIKKAKEAEKLIKDGNPEEGRVLLSKKMLSKLKHTDQHRVYTNHYIKQVGLLLNAFIKEVNEEKES